MAKQILVTFLQQAKELKLNLEAIGKELIKAGWSIEDVSEALEVVKGKKVKLEAPAPPVLVPPEVPK